MDGITWPRLTESLPHRSAVACHRCGQVLPGKYDLHWWQEHDDRDRPEPRYVLLCNPCADKIIEPHPRLYRRTERNEPCPGVMLQCVCCKHLDGLRCRHPQMRANGGPGVAFAGPDGFVRIQRAGPGGRGRRCETLRTWNDVPVCPVREVSGVSP
jgi:hypothetical protein